MADNHESLPEVVKHKKKFYCKVKGNTSIDVFWVINSLFKNSPGATIIYTENYEEYNEETEKQHNEIYYICKNIASALKNTDKEKVCSLCKKGNGLGYFTKENNEAKWNQIQNRPNPLTPEDDVESKSYQLLKKYLCHEEWVAGCQEKINEEMKKVILEWKKSEPKKYDKWKEKITFGNWEFTTTPDSSYFSCVLEIDSALIAISRSNRTSISPNTAKKMRNELTQRRRDLNLFLFDDGLFYWLPYLWIQVGSEPWSELYQYYKEHIYLNDEYLEVLLPKCLPQYLEELGSTTIDLSGKGNAKNGIKNYEDEKKRCLYSVLYAALYIKEYEKIWEQFFDAVYKKKLEENGYDELSINVLSIGCGPATDYRGLKQLLLDKPNNQWINIKNYTGIDINDWGNFQSEVESKQNTASTDYKYYTRDILEILKNDRLKTLDSNGDEKAIIDRIKEADIIHFPVSYREVLDADRNSDGENLKHLYGIAKKNAVFVLTTCSEKDHSYSHQDISKWNKEVRSVFPLEEDTICSHYHSEIRKLFYESYWIQKVNDDNCSLIELNQEENNENIQNENPDIPF